MTYIEQNLSMSADLNQATIWHAQNAGQLVAELRAGNRDSWDQLLSQLERRCLALAWRILKDSHLAADAVQEGFMRAYQSRNNLTPSSKIERWVIVTVANAARDMSRSLQRAANIEQQMSERQSSAPAISANTDLEERLRDALDTLDEQSRLVFLLVHQEGFSYQEVASEFGWPLGTIRSKLHRARLQLREQLLRRGFVC